MAYTIRKATREDVPEIMRLVQELADYEKMSGGPQLTEQDFIRDGGFDGARKRTLACLSLAYLQDNYTIRLIDSPSR